MIYFFQSSPQETIKHNYYGNRLVNAKAKIKHRKIQICNLQDKIESERESS